MKKKDDELTDLINEYVNKVDECNNMRVKKRLFEYIAAAQDVFKRNAGTVEDLELLKRIWKTCEGLLNAAPTLRDDKTIMKHMANIEMELDIKEIATPQPTQVTPQQAGRPFVIDDRLKAEKVKTAFEALESKGLITIHEDRPFEWKGSKKALVCFVYEAAKYFKIKNRRGRTQWKVFEELFGEKQLQSYYQNNEHTFDDDPDCCYIKHVLF